MTKSQKMTNDRYVSSTVREVFSRMRKFLFRAMLATVGVGGLVTGLPEGVLAANSNVIFQPESDWGTLSGESLRGIENRNNVNDYIFSETKPPAEREPIVLNRETEVSVVQVPETLLDLINRVDVNTGGSSLDSDELVKIRYRMDLS
jgi:hypothetical protein